ncbi:MAG: hypothetical protein RSE41_02875 [Clostridia bacterium]
MRNFFLVITMAVILSLPLITFACFQPTLNKGDSFKLSQEYIFLGENTYENEKKIKKFLNFESKMDNDFDSKLKQKKLKFAINVHITLIAISFFIAFLMLYLKLKK